MARSRKKKTGSQRIVGVATWGQPRPVRWLLATRWGARLTVLKGHGWIKNVVTVTILIFAVKLWLSS